MPATKEEIIAGLIQAYNMEVETIVNYLANSIHLDGVRADFVKQALTADIQEEMTHAQQIGNRIKQLGGRIPGSQALKMTQSDLQPPEDTTAVIDVIRGVLAAEESAIRHYNELIKKTDGVDYVTQDLMISILANEEAHRQQFEGYLKEYTKS
ncbi:MAG: hypothetical protein KatS3mg105_3253 [Gemmatales bacterium]|nr:MAG: hypothetical protein KatS3mg105_3253 [Gemmatales bacterium]